MICFTGCRIGSLIYRRSYSVYHSRGSWRPSLLNPTGRGPCLTSPWLFGSARVLLNPHESCSCCIGFRYVHHTAKRSYYDILGISRTASTKDIKSAYYELSKKYHPDMNLESESRVKFHEITEAYEVLGNLQNRRDYDESQSGWSDQSRTQSRSRYRETDMPGENAAYGAWNRQQSSGRRKYPQQRGKTEYWDFDEYYRQHYSETRQQQHREKQWKEFQEALRQQQPLRNYQQQPLPNRFIIPILFFLFLISVLSSLVERAPPDRIVIYPPGPYFTRKQKEEDDLLRDRVRRRMNSRLSTIYPPDDVELPPIDLVYPTKIDENPGK